MEASQANQAAAATAESKLEKQSVRGAMCKLAEDVIARRAEDNDSSLIEAIIQDAHSDVVCVSATYVASLPEIVAFAPKLEAAQREKFLVAVLENSEHLKTIKDKEGKVIIRTEYKRNPRNTLLMHNVSAEANESDLRELFLSIPTAASVSFKKDINSCWLATFDTEANAIATHRALHGQELTVKGSSISIGVRPTRFVRVTPASAAPAQPAAAAAQPGAYPGMRQQGMPQGMRAQYSFMHQQYWPPQMAQYWMPQYYGMPQQRQGGQHPPAWMQQPQQKPRSTRGGGHPRYQNPGYHQQQQQQQQQQQRAVAPEQMAAAGAAGAAAGEPAAAAHAPAPAATTAPAAAAPQQQQQQQQQQPREGSRQGSGRGNRNGRGRNRGAGGNRGHGGQSGAASEGAAAEGAAAEQHSKHQRQSAERQEPPAKPQKKPTADSFPPLA